MTAAVILAAGESSRLGQPKQLIQFRGKTLVRRITDAAVEADCSPVVVVAGSDNEKVRLALKSTNAVMVQNKNWQRGIGSSIRNGVKAVIEHTRNAEAALLLVCDQPFVNANTIKSVIALHKETKKEIVASSYAQTLGVPALFDRSLFEELLSLSDEAGAKSIILQDPERVAQFAFPEGAIDIDTPEDWEDLNRSNRSQLSETSHAG